MVENVARQHSAVADVEMTKGEDKEFVNGREELLAKNFFHTFVLIEEYGSGGVGIPEGSDLRCIVSNGDIWCCTRIRRRDRRGGQHSVIYGRQNSDVQEAEGSVAKVGVNRRGILVYL